MDQWRIGPLMWGALFTWIGLMLIIDEAPGVASIGAGTIFLVAAVCRRSIGRRAGFLISANGILLVLLGVNDLNGDDRGIPLLGTTMLAIGALIITKAFAVSRLAKQRGISVRRVDFEFRGTDDD